MIVWWALCAAAFPFLGDYVVYRGMPRNDRATRIAAAQKLGVPFDARTTLARYEALRQEDPEAVPLVTPLHAKIQLDGKRVIPIGAISRARTLVCNEGGEFAIYESDERGFHNPPGLQDRPAEVVLLGGSLVQGSCVRSDETIAAHTRRLRPSVVSLGMADTGPLTQLAILAELGPRIRPRFVVWMFDRTDPDDLAVELGDPLLREYLKPGFSQNLHERQAEVDRALRAVVEQKLEEAKVRGDLEPRANVLKDVLFLRHIRALLHKSDPRAQMPALRLVLDRGRSIVEQWGGKLVVAYLPDFVECGERGRPLPPYAPYIALTKELGLPVVDLLPVFQQHPDPASLFPLRMRGHYNSEGYRLVAETIVRQLEREAASLH
jgi:hypothetical protein